MPHIGASTKEAEENCAVMAANQLMDYFYHLLETHDILVGHSMRTPKGSKANM